MQRPSKVIAVEEHFNTPNFPALVPRLEATLRDLGEARLQQMDRHGIDTQILSLAAPGMQMALDAKQAVITAAKVNDSLSATVASQPTRFAGLASLPLQDPHRAADELERAIRQLGLCGAVVNGHAGGLYLDDERFFPVWERIEALDVPLYLHPAPPPHAWATIEGFPELSMAAWGWSVEMSGHALRIVCSGVFDRFPGARMVLGHMGELLPYSFERLDNRWLTSGDRRPLRQTPSSYFRSNIFISTSGAFSDPPLQCAISAMGADRILFAADYPFQELNDAAAWFARVPLDAATVELIAHANARRVFGLRD